MALTVRNKIWLGTIFLFFLLILTGGAGIFYTALLKEESKAVLKDNYESLLYCYKMQQQLDSMDLDRNLAFHRFDEALRQQEKNITEPVKIKQPLACATILTDYGQAIPLRQI